MQARKKKESSTPKRKSFFSWNFDCATLSNNCCYGKTFYVFFASISIIGCGALLDVGYMVKLVSQSQYFIIS